MDQITQIASAAEEQFKVSEDISRTISGMQTSTTDVSHASKGLSGNADNLLALSKNLNELVGQFKV